TSRWSSAKPKLLFASREASAGPPPPARLLLFVRFEPTGGYQLEADGQEDRNRLGPERADGPDPVPARLRLPRLHGGAGGLPRELLLHRGRGGRPAGCPVLLLRPADP